MVAPGENLEFQASTHVRSRANKIPKLLEQIVECIRDRPDLGNVLCPGIREVQLVIGEIKFVIFLARRGNKFSLMYIFQEHETVLVKEKRQHLIHSYGEGGFR